MSQGRTFDEMMLAIRAFQESRIFLTALELDVFSAARDASTAKEIAYRIGADPRATGMLLDALTALGALEKCEDTYQCTGESMALGPARAGLMHSVHLWDTWSTLTQCVQEGTSVVARGQWAPRSPAQTEHFIAAMHARALKVAQDLARAVDPKGVRRMLDVGGGPATFAIAFAQAEPGLQVELLDLGAVLPLAQANIRAAGLEDRVLVREGDLRSDPFGCGFDLVLLSAICHMLDEEENRDLLRRCAQALVPGGRIVLRDFLLEPGRTAPRHAALFALNMLVGTRRGNCYTEGEYRAWLEEACFVGVERLGFEEDVLVGWRP